MSTILWWVLIALFLSFGFLGCFISKVPGPIAVVLATLVAKLGLDINFEWYVVGIVAALAIASMVASKVLVKLVKKLHEYSKRATWGTIIGSIIGLCILVGVKGIDSTALVILIKSNSGQAINMQVACLLLFLALHRGGLESAYALLYCTGIVQE